MPIDLGSDNDELLRSRIRELEEQLKAGGGPAPAGKEAAASAGFVKAIYNVMYPGRADVPAESTVLAQMRDYVTQQSRQLHELADVQRDLNDLVLENANLTEQITELNAQLAELRGGGEAKPKRRKKSTGPVPGPAAPPA